LSQEPRTKSQDKEERRKKKPRFANRQSGVLYFCFNRVCCGNIRIKNISSQKSQEPRAKTKELRIKKKPRFANRQSGVHYFWFYRICCGNIRIKNISPQKSQEQRTRTKSKD
jgi:hypothetical protein